MDFVHDQLATGHKLRVLTIVDVFSRFSPALEPRLTFRGTHVVERACNEVGFPATIRVDQGSEFVSRDLDLWACQRGVTLDFSTSQRIMPSSKRSTAVSEPNASTPIGSSALQMGGKRWRIGASATTNPGESVISARAPESARRRESVSGPKSANSKMPPNFANAPARGLRLRRRSACSACGNVMLAPGNVLSVSRSAAALMRFNVAQSRDAQVMSILQRAIRRPAWA